jgi:hypothetical protein
VLYSFGSKKVNGNQRVTALKIDDDHHSINWYPGTHLTDENAKNKKTIFFLFEIMYRYRWVNLLSGQWPCYYGTYFSLNSAESRLMAVSKSGRGRLTALKIFFALGY